MSFRFKNRLITIFILSTLLLLSSLLIAKNLAEASPKPRVPVFGSEIEGSAIKKNKNLVEIRKDTFFKSDYVFEVGPTECRTWSPDVDKYVQKDCEVRIVEWDRDEIILKQRGFLLEGIKEKDLSYFVDYNVKSGFVAFIDEQGHSLYEEKLELPKNVSVEVIEDEYLLLRASGEIKFFDPNGYSATNTSDFVLLHYRPCDLYDHGELSFHFWIGYSHSLYSGKISDFFKEMILILTRDYEGSIMYNEVTERYMPKNLIFDLLNM